MKTATKACHPQDYKEAATGSHGQERDKHIKVPTK